MRRTKEDSEKTKESILDAAVTKFCEQGVATTTLSEIAAEAGVTRGAIYWHFKNKTDIFDALHERMLGILEEVLLDHMETDDADPVKKLQEVCLSLLKLFVSDDQKKQAIKLFWVQTDYSKEWLLFQKKHKERTDNSRNLFLRYFKEAQEKKALPPGADPAIMALAVRCYLKGIVLEYINEPELFDMEEYAPLMIEYFFKGLVR